ncbi:MAG: hypothetical protein K1X74_18970 [Pirellulales bacterium]|nr:hypothetical protein [Pirellulales bacterium]
MVHRISTAAAVLTAVWLGLVAPAAAQWGDLTGRIVLDGPAPEPKPINVSVDMEMCLRDNNKLVDEALMVGPEGGIANVLVYVRTKDVKINPELTASPAQPPEMDNDFCRFVPRVVGVMIKQPIVIKNSDPKPHNVNIQPLGDAAASINPLLSPNQEIQHKFNRSQNIPVPVACNIHPWMKGYILPRDNPYFAVTGADGSFKIEKLPTGTELEFQFWHENRGFLDTPKWPKGKLKLTLSKPVTDLGTEKLPLKLIEPKK